MMAVYLPLFFIVPAVDWLTGSGLGVFWRWITRKPGISPDAVRDQAEVRP